ncbi:hypothetical protein DVU_2649 [Nitratidesulfovibrio vulgaris str. Hildenborough]|uniref:Uncharacterized protein n=1 Tax=Nitratidesulfovibrio vulgaris (strain ATCC 29579 / DSM 644 / CCUG 34227 / NCIMB 8303 / VKM B-1760 / Hildenborough) TaxID=882 RepID=Q728F4_NITV2|nr:hypothetical protein DVU_2649 [Nitratidesulfovibrio vulgaris str. Hildenborough]
MKTAVVTKRELNVPRLCLAPAPRYNELNDPNLCKIRQSEHSSKAARAPLPAAVNPAGSLCRVTACANDKKKRRLVPPRHDALAQDE